MVILEKVVEGYNGGEGVIYTFSVALDGEKFKIGHDANDCWAVMRDGEIVYDFLIDSDTYPLGSPNVALYERLWLEFRNSKYGQFNHSLGLEGYPFNGYKNQYNKI